jgi:uncharacterized protein
MRRIRVFTFSAALILGVAGWGIAAPLRAQITEQPRPAHPATEAQIREYLSLIHAETLAQTAMASEVSAMQATAAPYIPPSFWDDLRGEFRKIDVVGLYIEIYQRYLSQEEMQTVLDFYHSPAGKKFLDVQPLAVADAQDAFRQKGQEIGAAVYAKHKDEIEAAKQKYEAGAKPAAK